MYLIKDFSSWQLWPPILCILLQRYVKFGQTHVTARLYSDVLLPCTFTMDRKYDLKYVLITWSHNGFSLAEYKYGKLRSREKVSLLERNLMKGDASLSIKNVSIIDEGDYECMVFDVPIRFTSTVRLEITATPKVSVNSPLVLINELNFLQLECHAQGFYPDNISIEWLRDTKSLPSQQPLQLNKNPDDTFNALNQYNYLAISDKACYNISCLVKHKSLQNGSVERLLQICKLPKVRIVPDTLVRGKDQIISCIIDGHFPMEISITWKKNGVPLRKPKTKDDSTFITAKSLMLNPVDENDEFTCEVKLKGLNETISMTKKFKFTGNSLSLVGILLIPILMIFALCVYYYRKKLCMKAKHHAMSEQIKEGRECQTLNGSKDIKNSGESDPENV